MKSTHVSVDDSTHWKFMELKNYYKCHNNNDAFTYLVDESYIIFEEIKARKEEDNL